MNTVQPQIQYVDVTTIKPYWNNPRDNEEAVEGLKKSIEQFGFLVPLVVDSEMVIVTGHTRYKASIELGLGEVPVIVADHLNDVQIKSFRLADNRLSENAKWDEVKLSEELRSIGSMGYDLNFTGFSKEELDCLCGMITADCLKDLDFKSVCGDIDPTQFKANDTMPITVGPYRFAVPILVFKGWETDMMKSFPKTMDLRREISRRLGLLDYYTPELLVESGMAKAETEAAPAAEVAGE